MGEVRRDGEISLLLAYRRFKGITSLSLALFFKKQDKINLAPFLTLVFVKPKLPVASFCLGTNLKGKSNLICPLCQVSQRKPTRGRASLKAVSVTVAEEQLDLSYSC